MSQNYEIARPLPPNVKRAATILSWAGNIGFWGQLILGVLAVALLSLSLAGLVVQQKSAEGTSFSIFCSIAGVLALIISIIICFRYKKIARLMRNPEATQRPKKASTLQLIRAGLLSNLVGIFFSIIGAEGFVGILWQKLSNIPQGAAVYDTSKLPTPSEILLLLANTHTVLCHFVGLVVGLYLLDRLDR
ncbi:DUF3611 family protein [Crocosphaera sp. UHCC 0190]|uniref:DUF3611 family protein n=1 Tax=unclassified Crocosphaera TaxID=2623705 RepID=UPI002B2128B6|nr:MULTISPECIES: DUF3611 family protein [unclassified Crocosphaera]MEA5512106.1 DUF3611 family protein [Crocosphaera sp. UHCC 0190]MEA5535934.1 DUF3611 family protein [Crocosphaera sp. XPORK-15E]